MRRLMTVERCFAFALVVALLGAIAGQAAELPAQNAQNKKPKQAEAGQTLRHRGLAGRPCGERRVREDERLYLDRLRRGATEVGSPPSLRIGAIGRTPPLRNVSWALPAQQASGLNGRMSRKAQPAFAHLGQPSRIPDAPDAKTLDRAANPQADTDYIARFTAPEFTSICPVTGQPDFAHLVIDYAPDKWIIEFEVAETLPRQLSQPRRIPRGLHRAHRQGPRGLAQASLAQNRRLLVSARRNADRRVLAKRPVAERRVAARSRRCALSRRG